MQSTPMLLSSCKERVDDNEDSLIGKSYGWHDLSNTRIVEMCVAIGCIHRPDCSYQQKHTNECTQNNTVAFIDRRQSQLRLMRAITAQQERQRHKTY